MKEYLKIFATPTDADGYEIFDIPFIATIKSTGQNLHCNQENKKIAVDGQGNASIVDSKPIVICHTKIVDCDWYENYVEIEFEDGMTWNEFVNSSYNDESKMTGEEFCIGKFSIDGDGYVKAPFSGFGPSQYTTPQKGTDQIISDIEYQIQGPTNNHAIYYDDLTLIFGV